ncbi:acid protease [Myriangium duriaei CBS 260.36]|uniref:Acid protease n=1 Tax=Myriangium duriaei CBS 260.36 TaxID=1168546 RepID=A0A9P4MIQ9_9PEZI|nr:acid protease [Myriangium duriaei CBS 260.36]
MPFLFFLSTVSACTTPLLLPIQNVSISNGFVSRGIPLSVGTPPQFLAVFPEWPQNNTYLYTEADRNGDHVCVPWVTTVAACQTFRGGLFDISTSSSTVPVTANASGADLHDGALGNPSALEASDSAQIQWMQDTVALGNTTLKGYPWGEMHQALVGFYGGARQGLIGLGPNSTILSTLKNAGQIASRTWGFFFGWDGVSPGAQLDGGLILGGYDKAKINVQGPVGKAPLRNPSACNTGMMVTVAALVMNWPNGTNTNVFNSDFQEFEACVFPSLSTIMIIPQTAFDAMNQAWGLPPYNASGERSMGVNDRSPTFETSVAPYDGRVFFTAAYLMVNQDEGTFTIWQANSTTDSRPVGVDTAGKDVGPNCTAGPANMPGNTTNPPSRSSLLKPAQTLTSGEIAGIAVGAVGGMVLLCIAAFLLYRRRPKQEVLEGEEKAAEMASTTRFAQELDNQDRWTEMPGNELREPRELNGTGTPSELEGNEPRESRS